MVDGATILNCDWCRDGLEVVGTYSYVDPTGAIVTVRYTAGVNGYEVRAVNLQLHVLVTTILTTKLTPNCWCVQETRERQEGAVKIVPAAPRPERVTPSSAGPQLDSEAIIRQVENTALSLADIMILSCDWLIQHQY